MSEAVVKTGGNLIKNGDGINTAAIFGYAAGFAETYCHQGKGLIVVTSGAAPAGKHRAEHMYGQEWANQLTLQQQAALGATAVFNAWEQGFAEEGVLAASVPITHRQLGGGSLWRRIPNWKEKRMFAQTLHDNAQSGIVTVVNEADAISIAELMQLKCGGDNDGLASHLARTVGAESLTLFTKKGGVFDDDGNLITEVNRHNIHAVKQMAARRVVGDEGRGGLSTKIEAAWQAAHEGIDATIAAVNQDMTGDQITRFVVG